MKNDFALTIVYTIATLGTITIALSPIKEDNIKNVFIIAHVAFCSVLICRSIRLTCHF